MKRLALILSALLLAAPCVLAQAQFPKPDYVVNLWPDGAPTDNGITQEEVDFGSHVRYVTKPTLSVFLPKHPSGLAVLVCPGGGYVDVWTATEGFYNSKWFTDLGIIYAVLKYRLPNGHTEVPLDDVHEAMRILRNDSELKISKLGVMGCSAGGHLASMAATHYSSPEQRPDFQILLYPVITMDPSYTHRGSMVNLLGRDATTELQDKFSSEKQVTPDTPQAFIVANTDDNVVPVRNGVNYYLALQENKVPATLLVYPDGGHGWADSSNFKYRNQWLENMQRWLLLLTQTIED